MPVLSISYDLHKEPRRGYEKLYEAIRKFPAYCRPLESTWFVRTGWNARQVFEYLKPHLHAKDKVCISPVGVGENWWSRGLSEKVLAWLHQNLDTKTGVEKN
ncbi:MAG: hypothetical protein L0Z62_40965 [Gemmataceae bacterium]|nr:hypothetical protein [Gemmataceae bacterium]